MTLLLLLNNWLNNFHDTCKQLCSPLQLCFPLLPGAYINTLQLSSEGFDWYYTLHVPKDISVKPRACPCYDNYVILSKASCATVYCNYWGTMTLQIRHYAVRCYSVGFMFQKLRRKITGWLKQAIILYSRLLHVGRPEFDSIHTSVGWYWI